MGREAECLCGWGSNSVKVKALLESGELILRGALRCKVPFSQMQHVRAEQDRLAFRFQGQEVSLMLGEVTASKWCQVIHSPPVSLEKKLGITPESCVWMLGETDDVPLSAALTSANALSSKKADLIVACVFSTEELGKVLDKTAGRLDKGVPLWIVYPKGKGHAVSESAVRSEARAIGLIDTKVASISDRLTGLRFIMRK